MSRGDLTVDYLVVGAGAMGMAFTDVLVAETGATIALVDRGARPGGHWTTSYPYVRLHQPSAFYGVNSLPLGSDEIDTSGGNAGLFELASGSEVVAYFDRVLRHSLLPSGRVHHLPMHEYHDERVTSVISGEQRTIRAGTVVDATYMNVVVPSMRPPAYDVADGVCCIPPNTLPGVTTPPDGFVVVGAGKTGIDACLWLLDNGVDPDTIRWIMPRDSWYLDRANIQPTARFAEMSLSAFADGFEASAAATSIDDLFSRLEAAGSLLRLDPEVRPTMYRCATVTRAEVQQLRRIEGVVRRGRVSAIGSETISLDDGEIPTTPATVHVDCSADGLARRPAVPVFDGDHITLQAVRTCQQVFSAAFIAHVAHSMTDDGTRNRVCTPVPHPDSDTDWLRSTLGQARNGMTWAEFPDLQTWLAEARLDGFSSSDPSLIADVGIVTEALRMAGSLQPAIENLERLLTTVDS
jgi:hypothetical protein